MPPSYSKTSTDYLELKELVAKLQEAARITADSIKALSENSKDNAHELAAIRVEFETLQKLVNALNVLVRTGDGGSIISIVTQLHLMQQEQKQLRKELENMPKELEKMAEDVEKLTQTITDLHLTNVKMSTGSRVLLWVGGIVGWVVTTAIAVYGAIFK
jgi:prefoldin subunit 5